MEHKEILFQVTRLRKHFPVKKAGLLQREPAALKAVDDVSLTIYRGETLALVGESGCGKTTLGRVLLQLYPQTGGTVLYFGRSRRTFCPRYVRRSIHLLRGGHGDPQDLAPLFGGLLASPDRQAVAQALLEEYDAGLRLQTLVRRGRATGDAQAALDAATARVEALRADLADRPDFPQWEALRHDGIDLARLTRREMRLLRKDLQMIFQDPFSSLDPRMSAGQIIAEPPVAHGLFPKEAPPCAATPSRSWRCAAWRRIWPGATPTSSAVASASVSASPGPWPCRRGLWSATRRSRRWMCPSRPKFSTCCRI